MLLLWRCGNNESETQVALGVLARFRPRSNRSLMGSDILNGGKFKPRPISFYLANNLWTHFSVPLPTPTQIDGLNNFLLPPRRHRHRHLSETHADPYQSRLANKTNSRGEHSLSKDDVDLRIVCVSIMPKIYTRIPYSTTSCNVAPLRPVYYHRHSIHKHILRPRTWFRRVGGSGEDGEPSEKKE